MNKMNNTPEPPTSAQPWPNPLKPKNHDKMMHVLCRPRWLSALVDELDDWFEQEYERTFIVSRGITDKDKIGFFLIHWTIPIPESFLKRLREDQDIYDHYTIDASFLGPMKE